MLRKPKRKIDGHLIPHSSYLLIFGNLHRNRVAHSRTSRWDAGALHDDAQARTLSHSMLVVTSVRRVRCFET